MRILRIILFDLDKLRGRDWKNKWRAVANKYLKIHGKTTMSDQDVFNAYIHDYPDEIKTLPCEYNYQLGSLTKSKELCDETPLGLHFNSQNKTVRRGYKQYNDKRKEIEGIDGTELRKRRSPKVNYVRRESTICDVFLPSADFRTSPNALGRLNKTADLCLITQFSIERLKLFLDNAIEWDEAISVAAYGTDKDLMTIMKAVKELNRTNIALHLVYADLESVYPINFLRNVAMNHSNCVNYLLSDVDFTIFGDRKKLHEQVANLQPKEVLVIPAFEAVKNVSVEIPQNITKLLITELIRNGTLHSFREKEYQNGHNATNVSRWIESDAVYEVAYEKDYEPYFVIRNENCPRYDQKFGGFGWNKVTHVIQLHMMDFKFKVSPTSFMIHKEHSVSDSLLLWREDMKYRQCQYFNKKWFIMEIAGTMNYTHHLREQ
ncbi:unnamed protein product [Caenorhabditis sp. 36 PRJEB53466]|nr:unnamed protein product [Caenorhabditis sp. 36 PRJEB53466]